jgi:hypothetical protein
MEKNSPGRRSPVHRCAPQSCVNPLQVIPTASVISIENLWDTDAAALHASV